MFWTKAEIVDDISYALLHTLHFIYCLLSNFKGKAFEFI